MTDVLVRGVSEEVLVALKARAARNNRSLQGELKELLERGAREAGRPEVDAFELARQVREKISSRNGGPFETDSTDIIREYRDLER